ncbi:hypothetical protein PRBEI_2000664300 [Prionailurus iriomotensis]
MNYGHYHCKGNCLAVCGPKLNSRKGSLTSTDDFVLSAPEIRKPRLTMAKIHAQVNLDIVWIIFDLTICFEETSHIEGG